MFGKKKSKEIGLAGTFGVVSRPYYNWFILDVDLNFTLGVREFCLGDGLNIISLNRLQGQFSLVVTMSICISVMMRNIPFRVSWRLLVKERRS